MTEIKKCLSKMNNKTNLFHHELLDRLYMITDMYNSFICEHDSDDILSKEEKEKMRSALWEQYQLVGARSFERGEDKQECENLKEVLRECRIGIKDISTESTEICKISEKYKRALEEIQSVIKSLENENIVTFPDLPLQQNVKVIMGQCNSGYKDILNIINKVKE